MAVGQIIVPRRCAFLGDKDFLGHESLRRFGYRSAVIESGFHQNLLGNDGITDRGGKKF